MKRRHRLGLVVLLGTAVIGVVVFFLLRAGRPYQPPGIAFEGDSKDLRESVVVPTLDTPMPKGKNVVWCGTIQLGWNRLEKDVLHARPRIQGAEAVVSRLNEAQLREEDVPPDSYFAAAGFVKDGIAQNVKTEMRRRFQEDVQLGSMPEPDGVLIYSYLQAHMAFTIPFFDNRESFCFTDSGGKTTEVSSFGIQEKDEYAYHRLREQVVVLYLSRNKQNPEVAEEFVLDLSRDSAPNQIVLAFVAPKATLAETLADVETKTRGYTREPVPFGEFGARDVLLVPNLNWEIRHHFSELEGDDKPFLNPGFTGYHFALAAQTIRFKLDRSGAELASEFKAYVKPMATHYVFDRPFLIYIKKRGRDRPFFVLWVDNAELLSKPQDSERKLAR